MVYSDKATMENIDIILLRTICTEEEPLKD